MKKYICIILSMLIALTLMSCVCGADFENTTIPGLNVTDDVEGAFDESQIQNKAMVLIFDQDSCVYCDILKEDTLSNEEVQKQLNENYIVVLVDVNENPEMAEQYQIFGTPSIQFLDSDGNDIERIEGYVDSGEFLDILKGI